MCASALNISINRRCRSRNRNKSGGSWGWGETRLRSNGGGRGRSRSRGRGRVNSGEVVDKVECGLVLPGGVFGKECRVYVRVIHYAAGFDSWDLTVKALGGFSTLRTVK